MSQPYYSLEAELHDAFWDAEDDGSEIQLMADFLKKYPGPALEIGSGSGRLMFPLLKMGFNIEGLELSNDMIQLGERRSQKLGIKAVVHAGDMSTWDNGNKFSSLLAPAFTLQLASDPEATLHHWHSLLSTRGGLYLTVFIPYAELLGDLPENQWYEDHRVTLPDGRLGLLETRHQLDKIRQVVDREHRYSISGNPPSLYHSHQSIRWIEHQELVSLLRKCGFRLNRFFVDFNPDRIVKDPDRINFDGILTYHFTQQDLKI